MGNTAFNVAVQVDKHATAHLTPFAVKFPPVKLDPSAANTKSGTPPEEKERVRRIWVQSYLAQSCRGQYDVNLGYVAPRRVQLLDASVIAVSSHGVSTGSYIPLRPRSFDVGYYTSAHETGTVRESVPLVQTRAGLCCK